MAAPIALRVARVAASAQQADAAGLDWLSAAERSRLQAITAPRRRAQFVAGRWALRALLAAEFGGDPLRDWPLTAAPDAPPRLLRPPAGGALHLALSHSGDWLACAAAAQPVGLDLEAVRPRASLAALIDLVCAPVERQRFREVDGAEALRRFLVLWTLKEAWFKRRGAAVAPERLAQVVTAPVGDMAEANARSWRTPAFVLALVAPAGAPLRGTEAFAGLPASPEHWQVG